MSIKIRKMLIIMNLLCSSGSIFYNKAGIVFLPTNQISFDIIKAKPPIIYVTLHTQYMMN